MGHNAEGEGAAAHEPMLLICYDHWSLLDPELLFKFPSTGATTNRHLPLSGAVPFLPFSSLHPFVGAILPTYM